MSVNLVKGQKVELRKTDGGDLKRVMIGLGWDAIERDTAEKKGFFSALFGSNDAPDIDCDASAMLCVGGKVVDLDDVVYFGNLIHSSDAVRHMGDNLTGDGEGDDEEIFVDLVSLPAEYDKIIFTVNIYKARERKQHFGMIKNAFIRICDAENNQELLRYNLSENYDNMTALVFGEVYKYNDTWKFSAIGQATQDNSISELVRKFA